MRKPKPPKYLNEKHSSIRRNLSKAVRRSRRADLHGGVDGYRLDRPAHSIPFFKQLTSVLEEKLASENIIHVLEKGAGAGNMIAHIKQLGGDKVYTTAISLRETYHKRNRPHINKAIRGIGIRQSFRRKFDIIYDCYGEDYHLPKELLEYSLKRTIYYLKPGGDAFTIIPLVYEKSALSLTVQEGRALIEKLARSYDVEIKTEEIHRRFEGTEYVDMVIHIKKKPSSS